MSFSIKDRDQEYCRVIVESVGYIERYLDGMSLEEFSIDSKTQDAVAMRLQQALESANKLSPEAKMNLKINWSALAAMRNKISHSYIDVDYEIVWQVVRDLEEFKTLVAWARPRI